MNAIFRSAAAAIAVSLCVGFVKAQTAYRCDNNGQTVYSEKPCVDAKAVAPTQDSDTQRQRSREAAQQMKTDDAVVNKQIVDRKREEAKEREAIRKAQKKESPKKSVAKEKKPKSKIKGATKKASAKKDKRAAKRDNRGSIKPRI
jgi:FtsZ-interacting cell division protein ZipA